MSRERNFFVWKCGGRVAREHYYIVGRESGAGLLFLWWVERKNCVTKVLKISDLLKKLCFTA